ncbi:MAG: DUF2191 domain-containing protein [Acidobacteriota bacterium]
MRTTITLDEDVAAKLKERSRKTGAPFKVVVNETLRLGLSAKRVLSPEKPFRVKARRLGLREGLSYDNVAELMEQVEGPQAR